MAKSIDELLEETQKLNKQNNELQRQLHEAKEIIDLIKAGNIDALVLGHKDDLKVYSEKTADKIFRVLIEKMNEGAVTLSKDGIILYCNSCFASMVNQPLQKVIGEPMLNFIENSSREHFDALIKQGWEGYAQNEIRLSTSDGKEICVLISVNTLSFDDNFVLSMILTDLTIQNKNQEELRRKTRQLIQKNIELESANKDLTSFSYVSSHDLQEPLRKIQNFVTCILDEEEKNLSETGKGYFQRLGATAKRMQGLIEDLLTYSRTKSDDRIFENTDLNLLLNEVKKDLEESIHQKKVTIEAANLCSIRIIPFQFRQLLHNLFSNSLKFSKPGVPLNIIIKSQIIQGSKLNNEKLQPQKHYCHMTFADNGIGFDPQYKDRIFEVFQRLHSFDEYAGTGIGLAICKRIVENHNGFITANGKLNEGAQFDIYIPTE